MSAALLRLGSLSNGIGRVASSTWSYLYSRLRGPVTQFLRFVFWHVPNGIERGVRACVMGVWNHREEIIAVLVLAWTVLRVLASALFLGMSILLLLLSFCVAGMIICGTLLFLLTRFVFAPMSLAIGGVSQMFGLANGIVHAGMSTAGVLAGAGRLLGTKQGAGLRGGR